MDASDVGPREIGVGAAGGAVAWVLGYVFTYVLAAPDLRESMLGQIIEFFQGDPATYEMVGWVFYNAHFVQTVFTNVPLMDTASFIGGDGEPSAVLYVIPVALLVATGLAIARLLGASDFGSGVLAGLLAVPGYLVLSIVGTFVFVVQVESASGQPDLLPAIVLAGIAYPALCAGAGGALAALTAND